MQNHDTPLRTNRELVHILRIYNGTNDVDARVATPTLLDQHANLSFAAINFFRNASRNTQLQRGYAPRLRITQSYVSVALSRAMVDFLLTSVNINKSLRAVEREGCE